MIVQPLSLTMLKFKSVVIKIELRLKKCPVIYKLFVKNVRRVFLEQNDNQESVTLVKTST